MSVVLSAKDFVGHPSTVTSVASRSSPPVAGDGINRSKASAGVSSLAQLRLMCAVPRCRRQKPIQSSEPLAVFLVGLEEPLNLPVRLQLPDFAERGGRCHFRVGNVRTRDHDLANHLDED